MSTLLLVRHGLTAVTGRALAGRAEGIGLDDRGLAQVTALGARLADVELAAIITSPLQRCAETADAIRTAQKGDPDWHVDDRLTECGYGDWTGQELSVLAKQPLWQTVQKQPSAARFPNGESLPEMWARSVAAVREWDERLGADAVWVACSHGDVIKAILADALGLHLDQFQRLVVDPASVSIVRYTADRPYVVRVNDAASALSALTAKPPTAQESVGGGSGAAD